MTMISLKLVKQSIMMVAIYYEPCFNHHRILTCLMRDLINSRDINNYTRYDQEYSDFVEKQQI